MPRAKRKVTVELAPDQAERLADLERSGKRSTEELVREAVERYLEAEEGRPVARARAAQFKKTRHGVADEDVEGWLESWGSAREKPCPKPRRV